MAHDEPSISTVKLKMPMKRSASSPGVGLKVPVEQRAKTMHVMLEYLRSQGATIVPVTASGLYNANLVSCVLFSPEVDENKSTPASHHAKSTNHQSRFERNVTAVTSLSNKHVLDPGPGRDLLSMVEETLRAAERAGSNGARARRTGVCRSSEFWSLAYRKSAAWAKDSAVVLQDHSHTETSGCNTSSFCEVLIGRDSKWISEC
jgi:hypothetical protein